MAFPFSIFNTRSATDPGVPTSEGIAVSGTDTYYSKLIGAKNSDGQSIHLEWSGTPTGTFTLWGSDKPYPNEANDTDWVQDTTFSPTNPAGSASKMMDTTSNMKANVKRIKYVNASGSGTLKGWATVPRGA